MNPRTKPIILTALALLCCAVPSIAAEKPNVLFIAVDDLRPELGIYGSQGMVTPNIDRLAKKGVRFERAYCMVPTCGASRAALMTGIRPASDRFLTHLARASEDAPGITTLNTHFKNNGYKTVSLGKIYHHPDDSAAGWTEIPWRANAPKYAKQASLKTNRKGGTNGSSWEDGGDLPDETYEDGQLAKHAIGKLKTLAAGKDPFFLAVGFLKPHLPFVAPGAYYDMYPAGSVKIPENYFPPKNAPAGAVHNSGELRSYTDIPKKGVLPEDKARELIRGYRAAASYTDAQIGEVLDALDRLGLAENTIIVLWGDHGWNLGEHTMWCKHSCFETSLRAPLLFTAPDSIGLKSGAATASFAEFIDVYPTLCDLTGLPKPDHLRGVSLMPILKDPEVQVKQQAISRFANGDSIRTATHRYSVYRDKKGNQVGHMLYDHVKDPGENINVADDPANASIVADLAKRLETGMGKPGDFKKAK